MRTELVFRKIAIALVASNCLCASASAGTSSLTCQGLKQSCLAHAAMSRKVAQATKLVSDPVGSDDQACYNAFDAAEKSGVWPSFGARPSLRCTP